MQLATGNWQLATITKIIERLIQSDNVPHFILVRIRTPSENSDEIIHNAAKLLLKAEELQTNPDFFEIKNDSIALSDVRQLKQKMFLKPQKEIKVFLIHRIERASNAAQSALLKITEETPPANIVVATTAALHALQPALVSRAFILKLLTKETETFSLSSKEGIIGNAIASTRIKMLERVLANENPLRDVCALERLIELLRQSAHPVLTMTQVAELTNALL